MTAQIILFPNSPPSFLPRAFGDETERREKIQYARRKDGTPAQVGDRVKLTGSKEQEGWIWQLGKVLSGRQTYSVMCGDSICRLSYSEFMEVLW